MANYTSYESSRRDGDNAASPMQFPWELREIGARARKIVWPKKRPITDLFSAPITCVNQGLVQAKLIMQKKPMFRLTFLGFRRYSPGISNLFKSKFVNV